MAKSFLAIGVALALGLLAFFVYKQTPSEAFKLVTDKVAAKAFCADLIDGKLEKADPDAPVALPVEVQPVDVEAPAAP